MAAENVFLPETVKVLGRFKYNDRSIVQTGDTLREYRKKLDPLSRRAWTVGWCSVIDEEDVPDVEEMFEVFGTHTSFLFLPPRERDYTETSQQSLLNTTTLTTGGDGSTTQFQLQITRTLGTITGSKKILHPITGTLVVFVNSIQQSDAGSPPDYTVDYSTGIVTFTVAPTNGHTVKATFEYYTAVRFLSDELQTSIIVSTADNLQEEMDAIDIIEVFDE